MISANHLSSSILKTLSTAASTVFHDSRDTADHSGIRLDRSTRPRNPRLALIINASPSTSPSPALHLDTSSSSCTQRNSHLYCASTIICSASFVLPVHRRVVKYHKGRMLADTFQAQKKSLRHYYTLSRVRHRRQFIMAATTLHRFPELPTEVQMLIWKACISTDNLGLMMDERFLGRTISHSDSSKKISRTSALSKSFLQCSSMQNTVRGNMSYFIGR